MDQPDQLKTTDSDPMGTDTEGVQPTHSFPGENEIGSMLADICAKIGLPLEVGATRMGRGRQAAGDHARRLRLYRRTV